MIGDKGIEKIVLSQESPCETIETIRDIDAIGHRCDDKNTQHYISPSYIHESDTWYRDTIMSELGVKPPCTRQRKKCQSSHLDSSAHAFFASNIADIEIIIYRP